MEDNRKLDWTLTVASGICVFTGLALNCKKSVNLRVVTGKSKIRGKVIENLFSCMWSITASFVLDTKLQERSSSLGKILDIEHSCHSYERIYEYCSMK